MFYSRFDAIFYLSTVRYMNEALKHAHDGDNDGAGVAMVEGLSSTYRFSPTLPRPRFFGRDRAGLLPGRA